VEENIEMGRQSLGWSVMDWIYLAVDSDEWLVLMKARMKFRVPESTWNFWSNLIDFDSGLCWEEPTFLCLLTSNRCIRIKNNLG